MVGGDSVPSAGRIRPRRRGGVALTGYDSRPALAVKARDIGAPFIHRRPYIVHPLATPWSTAAVTIKICTRSSRLELFRSHGQSALVVVPIEVNKNIQPTTNIYIYYNYRYYYINILRFGFLSLIKGRFSIFIKLYRRKYCRDTHIMV